MVRRCPVLLFALLGFIMDPAVGQDPFEEFPANTEGESSVETPTAIESESSTESPSQASPPASAKELLEQLDATLRAAAETKSALNLSPVADAAPKASPIRLVPTDLHLGKVYIAAAETPARQVRYLGLRVRLVNTAATPVTVQQESLRLIARGQELAFGASPRQRGLNRLPIGQELVELEELTKTGPVTVPPGEAVEIVAAFFDLPGLTDVPPMTLRLPVGDGTAQLDLNDYALGLMRLSAERIGPQGLLGLVTVKGEVTPVGVGGLVDVLEQLSADGASRIVIAWESDAPPIDPDLSNWLVQSAASPPGIPLNDGQHPTLPSMREFHLAGIPEGTGVPSLPGPKRVHSSVSEATAAAIASAYESLPLADLLQEIERGHSLIRPAAIAAGGRLPDEKLPLLLDLTADESTEIAKAAVQALREFGSPAAVERLVELAKTGPEPVRFSAVESLAASRFAAAHEALRALLDASASGPPVIPPESLVPVLANYPRPLWGESLYRLATAGDTETRSAALEALSRLGHPDLAVAFEAALATEDDRLRSGAFRLLTRRRDAAFEDVALRFTLNHLESEPPTREMYQLLQRTRDPRAVPFLLKHFEAGGANRSDLIRLLAQVGGLEVRAALEEAYPQLDRAAQVQALTALAQMQSPKLYDFAATAMRSNDPALVNTAAQQLTLDGGPEAVRLLTVMLFESTQPVILSNAANGLSAIGTSEARTALRKAARSDDARGQIAGSAWWQLQGQSPAWESFLAGRTAAKQEAWKQAAERYSDAVDLDPLFVDAWAGRANANMQLSDYAAARADYERTLELDPEDSAAVTCLGILRVFEGQVEEGLTFVRDRAAGFEKSDLFAYNRACLYSVAADRLEETDAPRAAQLRKDAVKGLARAIELGMAALEDIEWMKKDPDLAGLRERPDFKKVVAQGEKTAREQQAEEAGD